MSVLKLASVVSLVGLSLAGCVDDYGGGYGGTVYTSNVYVGGYDDYYGGYGGRYPYGGRYDRYQDRRWDHRHDDRNDYRRPDRDWQGHRNNRDTSGPRPDRQPDRQPNRQPDRAPVNFNYAPYSPSSCGSLDCTGKSLRGSNR